MAKKSVAVLEIGSQKATCIIGQRGVNGTFIIKSIAECEHDGFEDGHFYDNASIATAVSSVLEETAKNVRSHITTLYIGVPGEFSSVRTKTHTLAFPRKKRIRARDIENLYGVFELSKNSDYVITDVKTIDYILDDNRRVLNPEGQLSCKLSGYLCFMLCSKEFVRIMTAMCKAAGVKNIRFISESLAECLLLFSDEEREYQRVLVDVGYLTTNVMVTRGGGVLRQEAFSFGGGYITASLMDKLDLPFDVAESLKRKINLGYMIDADGKYRISVNENVLSVSLQKANFTVRFSIDELAEKINNVLENWQLDFSNNMPLALTGGGICYMRGAKELLASRVEMSVITLLPAVPSLAKPDASALLSLLSYALTLIGE